MEINLTTIGDWLDNYRLNSSVSATHMYCGNEMFERMVRMKNRTSCDLTPMRDEFYPAPTVTYSHLEKCLTISYQKMMKFRGCSIIPRPELEDGCIMIFDKEIK
jgi:hypothetical protein